MLDVKWPEFVEARGGVKFVDFKSYVRDLRGSGSRTLTVRLVIFVLLLELGFLIWRVNMIHLW